MEFTKHYHDVHAALDPDNLAIKEQRDADTLNEETEREIRKHPEKKDAKEATLAARQKDAADMIEFLKTRSLRAGTLDSRPSRSQWMGSVQHQEQMDRRTAKTGGIRAAGSVRKSRDRIPVLAAAQ